jgi:hypothetical protein
VDSCKDIGRLSVAGNTVSGVSGSPVAISEQQRAVIDRFELEGKAAPAKTAAAETGKL